MLCAVWVAPAPVSSWRSGAASAGSGTGHPRHHTLDRMTTTSASSAEGIDVASFQHSNGPINWPQVAADGYNFAYIKATEGTYYQNPFYPGDFAGARAAGMLAGAYTFATPDTASGTQEADYLLDDINYSNDGLTLPPMVDLEGDPYNTSTPCYGLSTAGMVSWIQAFVSEVLARTNRLTLIYTAASWWQECTGGTSQFAGDPLSIASYGTASPTLAAGWSTWVVWQFTSAGSAPGISGNTDLDLFDGGIASLGEFATNGKGNAQEVPVPVGQSNGTVDVFWRASNGSLDHSWYVPGGGWAGPVSQGGSLVSDPTAVTTGGGGLQVLYEGTDSNLWVTRYTGAWSAPRSIGMGPLGGAPYAVSAQPGVVDVFWRGSNNGLWHAWFVGGVWNGPQELAPAGSVASDPDPVSLGASGAMDVFWRGANGSLYDVQYRGSWSAAKDLNMGTLGSQPEGVTESAGSLVVAWVGTDQNIWYATQSGSGAVQGPTTGGDGPLATHPELAASRSGVADLFWGGADGFAWVAARSGNGGWSGATDLPSGVTGSQAEPAASSPGTLDVFWRGQDGGLWHAWGNVGHWAGPQRLGAALTFG